MSLLSIVQEVCGVVGVQKPVSIFAGINASRTQQELLDLANEMAQRIAYTTREWGALKREQRLAGDGVTDVWELPANFLRFLLKGEIWSTASSHAPLRYIADYDDFQQRGVAGWHGSSGGGEWTRIGSQIVIEPPLGVGVTARFAYLDKNCVRMFAGGSGDRFLNDGDTFHLPERVLKLGMIWQWKANKGSPYAEDMATYEDALKYESGADKPAPIIIGRYPIAMYAKFAYPWPLPTP